MSNCSSANALPRKRFRVPQRNVLPTKFSKYFVPFLTILFVTHLDTWNLIRSSRFVGILKLFKSAKFWMSVWVRQMTPLEVCFILTSGITFNHFLVSFILRQQDLQKIRHWSGMYFMIKLCWAQQTTLEAVSEISINLSPAYWTVRRRKSEAQTNKKYTRTTNKNTRGLPYFKCLTLFGIGKQIQGFENCIEIFWTLSKLLEDLKKW
jgi:hypothetical protein